VHRVTNDGRRTPRFDLVLSVRQDQSGGSDSAKGLSSSADAHYGPIVIPQLASRVADGKFASRPA